MHGLLAHSAPPPPQKLAKFPALFFSALCWAFNVVLLSVWFTSSNIPCRIWSLRRKACGPIWIFRTIVAVVLDHSSRNFSPHVTTQKCLVRTFIGSAALAKGVGNDGGPNVLPNVAPLPSATGQFGPPQTTQHGYIVKRMVLHHME